MTKSTAEAAATTRRNLGFSSLMFALFGWVNQEILLVTTNAAIGAHLVTAAFGLAISTVAYRRCRTWRTPLAPSKGESAGSGHVTLGLIGSGLALVAVGWGLASSMRAGFATTAVICAALLCFLPWSRSSICREYFFASHGLLLLGWIPVLFLATENQSSIMVLACTSIFWALAAGLALAILFEARIEGSPKARRPAQVEAEPKVYENAHER